MAKGRDLLRRGLRGPVNFGGPTPEASVPDRQFRPAWAEIDLQAVRHNARILSSIAAPAQLCAVVKADGYGHGAVEVAKAAIEGGAAGLAVALVEEGMELKRAGIGAPVLLLSEPPADAADMMVAAGMTPTLYSVEGVGRVGDAARNFGTQLKVHVKVDTGMHRVGADPMQLPAVLEAIARDPALTLQGLWTHLAVADGLSGEDRVYTASQLQRFEEVLSAMAERPGVIHAANSAGTIAWPESRFDLVRCGIALYGQLPSPTLAQSWAEQSGGQVLRPVMSLKARVSSVRDLPAGERPSYGRLRALPERATVATVPLGYADGVPRALFGAGFEVLIGGRRRPLAGMVTMDQIVVDCGPESTVAVGDEVVLLGRQGTEEVTAGEWAQRLGTISYEVLCGIGPRVPRLFSGRSAQSRPVSVSPPMGPA